MTSAPAPGWRARLTGGAPLFPLVVLVVLQGADQALQSAIGVLVPELRDAFGLSDAGILAIVAASLAAALLCTVPVAYFADRTRRVTLALAGAAIGSAFAIGVSLAWTTIFLAVMLCGMAMGQAVIFPTHNSLIADFFPVRARTRVYSLHRAGLSVGAVVGVLLAAGLADAFSWRAPFVVFAIPVLVVAAIGLKVPEPARGHYEAQALAEEEAEEAARAGSGAGAAGSLAAGPAAPPAVSTPAPAPAPVEEEPPSLGEAWRMVWKIGVLRRTFAALPFLAAALVGFSSLASLQYQQTFHLGVLQRGLIIAPVQVFDLGGLVLGAAIGTRLAAHSRRLAFHLLAVSSFAAAGFAVLFALAPNVPVAFVANGGIDAALVIVGPGVLASLSLAIPARARSLGFSLGALFVLPGLVVIPIVGAVGDAVGLRYGMLVLVPVFVVGGLILASGGHLVEGDIRNVWTSMRARSEMAALRREGALPLLAVRDLSVGYDGVRVLAGVDVEIAEREIVALLGTNGAGKSTLLRAIGGVAEADGGAVVFDGRDITHAPPDEIARCGIAQLPGGEGVFPELTVEENLRAAAWQVRGHRGAIEEHVQAAIDAAPLLAGRRRERAGNLSGGQQQQLALAMVLLTRPRLLLIDELSLGLAPVVVETLLESVRALRDEGTAVLLVEQSVNVALSVADRAYVLDGGAVRFAGSSAEVAARPDLLWSIYLRRAVPSGSGAAPVAVRPAVADAPGEDAGGPGGAAPALSVRSVSVSFGGIAALEQVDLEVEPGEIVGVIGPNGAGKTTLFDVVSGFVRPSSGRVLLGGVDVTAKSAPTRARLGLGRSFQDSRLFSTMTVAETLSVAFERFVDVADPLNAVLRLPAQQRTEAAVADRAAELIDRFGLGRFADRPLAALSTGSRRLVDLATVVAQQPTVVLLDEPTSGIAQREVEAMKELLVAVAAELAATLVVVEHDIAFVADLADRLVALDQGEVLASGLPDEVLGRPDVEAAFLGTSAVVRARSGAIGALAGAVPGEEGREHSGQ
ncbi:MAG: MFS transporter [Actinomycetota bacterium]|nr:MFS transporter [Actinomycetota bacterium]